MNLLDLMVKIGVEDKASSKMDGITTSAIAKATVMGQAFYDAAKYVGGRALDMGKAMVSGALEGYGAYEQLEGGVKKLYGGAADTIFDYAQNAYKTAGMSANQYMEQATSFSAALVNSLGGDTQKAAEQTDLAMRAMSDNVNTFGSDMGSVQMAFQGFAKQNYTMLDNLKLGYGGTKSEMERLISDANEYAASIGEASDLSVDSFSDVVTAIDLIQRKQNIAGTTVKEAMTTIEGSVTAAKASWENLITAIGSGDMDMINSSVSGLVDSIFGTFNEEVGKREGGIIANVIPVLQNVGRAVVNTIPEIASTIASTFLQTLHDEFGVDVSWAEGFLKSVRDFGGKAKKAFEDFGKSFSEHFNASKIGSALDGIGSVVGRVFDFIAQNAGTLGSVLGIAADAFLTVADVVSDLVNVLGPFLPLIAGALAALGAISAITPIVTAFSGAIGFVTTVLIPAISMVGSFGGAITLLTTLLGGPIPIIAALVGAVVAFVATNDGAKEAIVLAWQAVVDFFTGIPEWWSTLWDGVSTKIGEFVTKAGEAWDNLNAAAAEKWEALKTTISQKAEAIKNGVNQAWENVKTSTKNAWDNVKTSTTEKWQSIKDTATQKVQALKDSVSERVQALKDAVSTFWDNLKTATVEKWESIRQKATDASNNMKNAVSNAVESLKNAVREKFDAVVSFARDMPSRIVNALSDLGNRLRSVGSNAINNMMDGIKGSFNWVRSFFSGIPSTLVGAMGNVWSWFSSVGQNMMSGLVNGIYAGWSWVVNAAASVARSALNAAKSFLGISSPSKEFAKVGKFTMEGFTQGIERTSGDAIAAVQKAMEDVASVQAPEINASMVASADYPNKAERREVPQISMVIENMVVRDRDDAEYMAQRINEIWRLEYEGALA